MMMKSQAGLRKYVSDGVCDVCNNWTGQTVSSAVSAVLMFSF